MTMEKCFNENSAVVRAIREAYRAGQEDESLEPIVKVNSSGKPIGRFSSRDYVIFYDIRGEREIQLTQSLTEKDFNAFSVEKDLKLNFVTMIDYDSQLNVKVAFPSEKQIKNTLAELISKGGLKLVKISESEKAVHVGFFMNGKNDRIFPNEYRITIPSLEVSSYANCPEMNVSRVTQEIISHLRNDNYQVIIANLANVDVVGHIENRAAVIRAVEAVDSHLGKIIEESRVQGVTLIVTSDHGTVEEWLYPEGAVNTGHTKNGVPFVLADFYSNSSNQQSWNMSNRGELADVAPTLLELLGFEKPVEMTGQSLLLSRHKESRGKRRILLLILDGWGYRDEVKGNLIVEAKTPHFDRLWKSYPHAVLEASGEAVGMPPGTVGNSEAGHLHLGAGRRVVLDRVKIDNAIQNGSFFENKAFLWAIEGARRENKALHLLGIVSHYSSHGTIRHLFALLHLAKRVGLKEVFIHSLIGRRGEKPESGAVYVNKIEQVCEELSLGEVVTVMGRYWALDREENWDRVEKAYQALVYGKGKIVSSKQ